VLIWESLEKKLDMSGRRAEDEGALEGVMLCSTGGWLGRALMEGDGGQDMRDEIPS
jgi:hypothetical protein